MFDSCAALFLQIAALKITFPVQWDNSLGLPQHLGRKIKFEVKFEVQLNSTDAEGLFEEWGFYCCGLSFGRPTRERPAAVFRERLGVDGRLDFLPPIPTR